MQYNKFDKNGSNIMAIYCFQCSKFDHANMHGSKKSKGFAIVTNRHEDYWDFKCVDCGYENINNTMVYIKDYGIRK